MKLVAFQVSDFRSINDSTPIELAHRTCLVGRNESGKTALLRTLQGIKAQATGNEFPSFTFAKDFPRDRPRSDFHEDAVITWTKWELSDEDRAELAKVWPRAASVSHAYVQRKYRAQRTVSFEGLTPITALHDEGRQLAEKVSRAVRAVFKEAPDKAGSAEEAVEGLRTAVSHKDWGDQPAAAAGALRAALNAAGVSISKPAEEALDKIEHIAADLKADEQQHAAARSWVAQRLPVFVYLDEWAFIDGEHNIEEYLTHKQQNTLSHKDLMFEKLLKVADLDAANLKNLLGQNPDERTLLTDRASKIVTRRLRELWKDRELDVDFRVDAQHFRVHVKNSETRALVGLNERSRGFRWYFSFYVTFTADTMGGDKTNAILLLDEPGLFLHATAQGQLLTFFRDLPNQIIYTTHSPFMIDPGDLGSVRTVNLDADTGTTVSSTLSGDARTLFPLQAALGYDITQTLFVGKKSVVIEGVTDYWYLNSVAEYLREQGTSLDPDIVLTPAGGAQKVSYLVALLAAQNLHVAVLLDTEPGAEQARDDLVKSKLIRGNRVVYVSEAFPNPAPKQADIEDLLDSDVFMQLVQEAYAKELEGKTLTPNPNIPRIVSRTEDAFSAAGLTFHKSRVARLFMSKMAKDPTSVVSPAAAKRFRRLLAALNKAIDDLAKADRGPFG